MAKFYGNRSIAIYWRIGIIVIIAILMFFLAIAHWAGWVFFQEVVNFAKKDGENWSNDRLSWVIRDDLYAIWRPHSVALVQLDTAIGSFLPSLSHLDSLNSLPGVLDAFAIDLTHVTAVSRNRIIQSDTIVAEINRQRAIQTPHTHKVAKRLWERFGGGATQFLRIGDSLNSWPVLVRFDRYTDVAKASRAIGLVLDEKWFLAQIPLRMDSLMRENTNLLLYGVPQDQLPSQLIRPTFSSDDGDFQQTIGILYGTDNPFVTGGDTLCWYGDRTRYVVFDADTVLVGSSHQMNGFNIGIGIRVEHLLYERSMAWNSRIATKMFIGIEIFGLMVMALLFASIMLIRRQSRRNQIALAHLAHSVKTPVARLQLAADILEGGQVSSPDEERKVIQTVSGECRQLRRAVENAALTMEGGRIAIFKEPGDLAGLVRETAEVWQASFVQAGIRLEVHGIDKPLETSFDRDKLRLAIDNLIDNALRHSYLNLKNLSSGLAVVTVSLRSEGKNIFLSVNDSGAGIPKADMKNVFKRFGRSGKDPLTGVSGLGLGLALVKEIAEGHGGKVRVEADPGGGAKFVVELP